MLKVCGVKKRQINGGFKPRPGKSTPRNLGGFDAMA